MRLYVYIESSLKPMTLKVPPRKVCKCNRADYDGMRQELRYFKEENITRVHTKTLNPYVQLSNPRIIPTFHLDSSAAI